MSRTKKFLLIRILCFTLSGLILSSSVIMCNQNAMVVNAMTDSEEEIARDALYAIAAIVGLIPCPPYTQIAAVLIPPLGNFGISIIDHIQDNGDGTYTIDAELVQAVNEVICNQYISGSPEQDENGFYTYGAFDYHLTVTDSKGEITEYSAITNAFNSKTPVGYYLYLYQNYKFQLIAYTLNSKNELVSWSQDYWGDITPSTTSNANGSVSTVSNILGLEMGLNGNAEFLYSFSLPLYTSKTSLQNALISGSYLDAENYRGNYFDVSSRFTGLPYSGGDITISAAKLEGIEAKLNELNETTLSVDEKMDAILDYLEEDEESGDDGGGDSGDDEEDEDKPTTILEWLEKINDNLKDILKQVKQIKWLSVADLIDDIIFNLIELKNDFEPVVQTMSEKFPFSLPWDTVLIFSLLADSPETPYYEIPFVIPSAGIDEFLIVDLARFEKLSKISRFLLTLTFLMMLFALTRKIAHWLGNNKN